MGQPCQRLLTATG